jgi:uncharacterized protein YkwD
MRSWVARATVAVAAVVGLGGVMTACDPAPTCATIESRYADAAVKDISRANAEKAVLCLTNDQRVANGLAKYTSSSLLGGTARKHAQDAVIRKWWIDGADPHTNPDGQDPAERISAAGYCPSPTFWQVAENVYWGWGTPLQTPRAAVTWWMNSPPHRANILDPNLKELGVGVTLGAPRPGTYPDAAVFVQNFGLCR